MKRLVLLTGFFAGYVLGARAGRERYETIMRMGRLIADRPAVQSAAGTVAGGASETAKRALRRVR